MFLQSEFFHFHFSFLHLTWCPRINSNMVTVSVRLLTCLFDVTKEKLDINLDKLCLELVKKNISQ